MNTNTAQRNATNLSMPDTSVICGCIDLTFGQLRTCVARGDSYDTFLSETTAGSHCTSCMLDLEYQFEAATKLEPGHSNDGKSVATKQSRSLKRRIFDWIDQHSPLMAWERSEGGPILLGQDIEQWIVVANQNPLFEDGFGLPTVNVKTEIRDPDGKLLTKLAKTIMPGNTMRLNLTEAYLKAAQGTTPSPGNAIAGSFHLSSRWSKSGYRGTTRPQFIVTAANGCDAVHTIGPNAARDRWISCFYRPEVERDFISIVNAWNKPTKVRLSYPMEVPGCDAESHDILIPPRGTHLHEVILPAEKAEIVGENPIDVHVTCDGLKNLHLFIASQNLDRISVDHV